MLHLSHRKNSLKLSRREDAEVAEYGVIIDMQVVDDPLRILITGYTRQPMADICANLPSI